MNIKVGYKQFPWRCKSVLTYAGHDVELVIDLHVHRRGHQLHRREGIRQRVDSCVQATKQNITLQRFNVYVFVPS